MLAVVGTVVVVKLATSLPQMAVLAQVAAQAAAAGQIPVSAEHPQEQAAMEAAVLLTVLTLVLPVVGAAALAMPGPMLSTAHLGVTAALAWHLQ
ncbi:MAG: hypothetical protein AAFU38_21995 [Bacteroidota bacterium]